MIPFSFYTYEGSLTKPPCNENTIHYVASEPIPLSNTVIELFKESLRIPDLKAQIGQIILNDNSIMHSNRSVQKQNGRPVFFYESKSNGFPIIKRQRKKNIVEPTHFERKKLDISKYFFVNVNDDQPSNMPDEFVFSEEEARNNGDLSFKK